jgi:hypothetical protein
MPYAGQTNSSLLLYVNFLSAETDGHLGTYLQSPSENPSLYDSPAADQKLSLYQKKPLFLLLGLRIYVECGLYHSLSSASSPPTIRLKLLSIYRV